MAMPKSHFKVEAFDFFVISYSGAGFRLFILKKREFLLVFRNIFQFVKEINTIMKHFSKLYQKTRIRNKPFRTWIVVYHFSEIYKFIKEN